MEKILSVSVAAYNAAKDICNCLDSLLNTDVKDYLEIIVVNDGSKDNTEEIVRKYVEQYPEIVKLIDKENGGHGSTINASIRIATGKYYKIVDSDDWVEKDGIEKLVRTLKDTHVDLVLNPYHDIDANTRSVRKKVNPFQNAEQCNRVYSIEDMENIQILMHSVTFKADVIRKMGPVIDEKCFYVDLEYILFSMLHVKTYMCCDYPVYCYLLGTATQSVSTKNMIARRAQHLKVVKRIVSFYEENKVNFREKVRAMVANRIYAAVMVQYKIYFRMEEPSAKQEAADFDRWLKAASPELYEGKQGKMIKILKFMRFTNFALFKVAAQCLQLLKVELR